MKKVRIFLVLILPFLFLLSSIPVGAVKAPTIGVFTTDKELDKFPKVSTKWKTVKVDSRGYIQLLFGSDGDYSLEFRKIKTKEKVEFSIMDRGLLERPFLFGDGEFESAVSFNKKFLRANKSNYNYYLRFQKGKSPVFEGDFELSVKGTKGDKLLLMARSENPCSFQVRCKKSKG